MTEDRTGVIGLAHRLLSLQIVRFGLIGVVNTAFGYGLFVVLQLTLGKVVHYLVVLLVSNVISVVQAYVLQRRFTFRYTGGWLAGLARFATVYAIAFVVNLGLLPFFVEIMHIPVIPAQGIVTVLQVFGTYAGHRAFTFRHRPGSAAVAADAVALPEVSREEVPQ